MMKILRATLTRDTERRPFQCAVQVSWQTRSGESKFARGKFLDISPQGGGIESNEPIEPRTIVYLQAPGCRPIGNASVRYCVRCGLKYHIGLLFSAATKLADAARQKCLHERALQEGPR
jgi:hypothetical protein